MRYLKFFFLLLLSSCMVGPDYVPPNTCIDGQWQTCEETSAEPPVVEWWQLFGDPLLNKYIELAYFYNNDLYAAEANIMQARAMRMIAASALFPQVIADFNASRTYFSKNGPIFSGPSLAQGDSATTGLPFQIQIPQIQNLYNALIDVTWELDLWGKTRRNIEAAAAEMEASIEQRNDLLLSIMSEIASSYIEIRSLQKRGQLLEENISRLEQNAEISRRQFQTGYRNRLDLDRIEAELLTAQAALPNICAQILQNIYALSVLTGHLPETFMDELMPFQQMPKPPENVAVGLRSDLLRRRPDVRSAERMLAAATANIGVAVAAFFPTVTLSADIGFQSLNLYNLFQSQSKT